MKNISLLIFFLFWITINAHARVTLISDPKVLSIPVQENHDGWVDLRHQSIILYGPSPEVPNNQDYFFLRKTVYEKLKKAQAHLPKGLRFSIYEGYRSLKLQKMIFEKQYQNVKKFHPDWKEQDIFIETTRLVSPVKNPDQSLNIPPHSTGGAIDVYLIDENANPLEMGIHPKDWMKDKGGLLSQTQSQYISETAQKNRKIMAKVLLDAGFVNYPTEYWHWSYGDKYWAYILGRSKAIYGNEYSPSKENLFKKWPKWSKINV